MMLTRGPLLRLVLGLVAAVGMAAGAIAFWPAMQTQEMYGTLSRDGPPPQIHFCDRNHLPAPKTATKSGRQVADFLALNRLHGLERIGTTPSGMRVMASIVPPAMRVSMHTAVCTMSIWVETGPDRYLPYSLSGGP